MISRRDFIKLVSLLGLSPLAGCVNDKEVSMQLGDLVAKWAKGGHLSAFEAEYVRVRLNNIESISDVTGGWIDSGHGIYAPSVRGALGDFSDPPSHGMAAIFIPITPIPNNSETLLNLFAPISPVSQNAPLMVHPGDPSRFDLNPNLLGKSNVNFKMAGIAQYADGASYAKKITFKTYNASTDALIATQDIVNETSAKTFVHFNYLFPYPSPAVASWYYKFYVTQVSGNQQNVVVEFWADWFMVMP